MEIVPVTQFGITVQRKYRVFSEIICNLKYWQIIKTSSGLVQIKDARSSVVFISEDSTDN